MADARRCGRGRCRAHGRPGRRVDDGEPHRTLALARQRLSVLAPAGVLRGAPGGTRGSASSPRIWSTSATSSRSRSSSRCSPAVSPPRSSPIAWTHRTPRTRRPVALRAARRSSRRRPPRRPTAERSPAPHGVSARSAPRNIAGLLSAPQALGASLAQRAGRCRSKVSPLGDQVVASRPRGSRPNRPRHSRWSALAMCRWPSVS
jgi:hypothetical protein